MVNKLAIVLFVALVVATLTLPANASLVPMSWGFPTMVQNNSLTSFTCENALANDFEVSDISFPTTSSSIVSSAFPTITQMSNQSQLVTKFAYQNQQQNMQFAYPWISIGFSPVPSMGFL